VKYPEIPGGSVCVKFTRTQLLRFLQQLEVRMILRNCNMHFLHIAFVKIFYWIPGQVVR